jgi:hypothetical protein
MMNYKFSLGFLFSFCISKGYTSKTQSLDPQSILFEMEEGLLAALRNRKEEKPFSINHAKVTNANPMDFLRAMELMGDLFFLAFWASYKYDYWTQNSYWPPKARNAVSLFQEVNQAGKGKDLLINMSRNYKMYLDRVILNYQGVKGQLITQAMALYYGKFHLIWRKLGITNSEEFDAMRQVFIFYQEAIDQDIYSLVEFEFSKFFKSIYGNDRKKIRINEARFVSLVQSMFHNEKGKRGMRWISNHQDPYLTLFYLFYQIDDNCYLAESYIHRFKNDCMIISIVISGALFYLKTISEYSLYLCGKYRINFSPYFRNTLAHVYNDFEIIDIIRKSFSKVQYTNK